MHHRTTRYAATKIPVTRMRDSIIECLKARRMTLLIDFLKATKASFLRLVAAENKVPRPFWIVLGNEAHDLDSQNSSIALAYLLSRQHPNHLVFPIMNVPRNEARLRRDNLGLLQEIGTDETDLLYLSDIASAVGSFRKLVEENAEHCKVAIVDHNELSPRQIFLRPFVKVIIDHHVDAKQWDDRLGAQDFDIVIKRYASSATLIAERILQVDAAILEDRAIRQLLSSAILMDSGGLSSGDAQDQVMYDNLAKLSGNPLKQKMEDRQMLHNLSRQRMDLSGLSATEIVKKDLKYATDRNKQYLFAVSSVKVKAKKLGLKERASCHDFMTKLIDMLNEEQADSDYGALTAYFILIKKKGPYRRLLVAVRTDLIADAIIPTLESWLKKKRVYLGNPVSGRRDPKELFDATGIPKPLRGKFVFRTYELNQPASRKQVMPFLVDVLSAC